MSIIKRITLSLVGLVVTISGYIAGLISGLILSCIVQTGSIQGGLKLSLRYWNIDNIPHKLIIPVLIIGPIFGMALFLWLLIKLLVSKKVVTPGELDILMGKTTKRNNNRRKSHKSEI